MSEQAINIDALREEERAALALKTLYGRYGYDEYKLSGFEDYSLYAENKSFLDGNGVLSFSSGGRLLALRPDVTLSVVKNASSSGVTSKLFYDERVYRKASGGGDLAELRQIGVEVIGRIDGVTEAEVCALTVKTLAAVGRGRYMLDISHVGITEKLLNACGLDGAARRFSERCLRQKSAHDFYSGVRSQACNRDAVRAFASLIDLPSEPSAALDVLRKITCCDISSELTELADTAACGGDCVSIDFSIGGDSDYYNGIVFKGYVEGVPFAVLSGGRYDRLMKRFGKSEEAIGFALYVGELFDCLSEKKHKPDALVLYDDGTAAAAALKADRLRAEGLSVLLRREVGDFDGKIYTAEGDGHD